MDEGFDPRVLGSANKPKYLSVDDKMDEEELVNSLMKLQVTDLPLYQPPEQDQRAMQHENAPQENLAWGQSNIEENQAENELTIDEIMEGITDEEEDLPQKKTDMMFQYDVHHSAYEHNPYCENDEDEDSSEYDPETVDRMYPSESSDGCEEKSDVDPREDTYFSD